MLTLRHLRHAASAWARCLLPVFLLSLTHVCWASATLFDRFEHRRWTRADAAPSQIGALAQTRDGYLWLGTNDSLYRFDGLHFVRYSATNGKSLGIVSTLQAEDEGLWVGFRTGGVSLVTEEKITSYGVSDGLPNGVVYGIVKDRSGAVWAAANDGLARFDGKQWHRIGADWSFPGQHAHAVFVDRAGKLWAANEQRLFYLPPGGRAFIDTGLSVDRVNQISQAPDGAIWVAERYGGVLRRIAEQGGAVSTMDVIEGASRLLFDSNGATWVAANGGIRYVPASTTDVPPIRDALSLAQQFYVKDGLSADTVRAILEDEDGNIWLGTTAGLDRFRASAMVVADLPKQALNFALAAGQDGSIFAGTSNLPAMRLDRRGLTRLDVPAPIQSAFSDSTGAVWLAGTHGIWRAQNDAAEFVAPLPTTDLPDSAARALTVDREGNVWLSVNRTGLFVLRDGRWTKKRAPSDDPRQIMPVTASKDAQGYLWFGYRNNLIVTYDGDKERHWGAREGLLVGHVTAMLHLDSHTWVGGQHGLARFDGEHFHHLLLPDNGLFDNIYAIMATPSGVLSDPNGYDLWLHSKGGIFQLTASELQQAMLDPEHPVRYRSHEAMGGLANDPHQVLPVPTAVRTTDGRLWFSTSSGVIWLDPTHSAKRHATSKPIIESFTADGKEHLSDRLSRLGPQPGRIEIAYTALDLSGYPGLHFRYRLDGHDSRWQQVGTARTAVYNDLGPGQYRFRVRTINPDGILSADEASLSFTIRPMFYRDPWFIFLFIIMVFVALWLLYRVRMHSATEQLRARLQERHEERERIARELHDTLMQGVHGLVLSFQAAIESLPPAHPSRKKIERVLDRADLVLVEARNRVNDLREGADCSENPLTALRAVLSEWNSASCPLITFDTQGVPRPLHPIVGEESYAIGREAIVNTLQHANAQNMEIKVIYGRHAFQLIIADDGVGIDPQYLPPTTRPGHWGVHGMFERADKIGGKLSILRGAKGGTTTELTIPASTAYRESRRDLGSWLRSLFR
ncbi:MAG TPA: two-component regulator propeller domain-containing protein [Bordetella sp.]|nr:two-component regulator propeller domain-containing protein [Bordetella sp.]